ELWVDLSGASTMLGGSPAGIISVMDINDRKIAEEALRESEAKYRSILENIQEGYFELDLAGTLTFFNESLCAIFAYPKERLVGADVGSFIPTKSRSQLDRVMEQIRRTGLSEEIIDLDILKGDGNTGAIAMTMSAIRDSSGSVTGFRGVARDVTEHRRLEAQLLQAQKMEAIGTLAGGIAHDFNNLLMAIQGNVSLLSLDLPQSSPDRKRIEHIEQCIRSGSDLTRQLLGFARGGKYEVTPTDLNRLITKTADMFGHARKEISIHTDLDEGLWSVEVDQGQIEQVLLNLYVNAWHAMPGGGELFLKSDNLIPDESFTQAYEARPGRFVRVSVTDTGVGMDEATRQRVFEPFFTTRDKSRGSGLGLASAYGIVRNHGGFISVYSEVGMGSTFNVYLPASDKAAKEHEDSKQSDVIRGTKRVLLIDDEDMVLTIGGEILEKLGYTVLRAESGEEALELFHEHKDGIDLVILDMIMPGIGGSEVFDRIRAESPEVKVILSSGYSMNDDTDRIMKRGCNGFIQKPFDIQTLSRKIRTVLDV
ncbi:MAG TPA: response regulator, partial [Deltaproteobacteria bacterium]|nr:response regulator [Deltaproteobacteria bacterium]